MKSWNTRTARNAGSTWRRVRCDERVCRGTRIRVFALLCLLWSGVVVHKLVDLQLSGDTQWAARSKNQHVSEITISSARGAVMDREGRMLAVSVPASSVYVRPRQIKDADATVKVLAEGLKIPEREVRAKLTSEKPFVWIARQIPRQVAEKVTSSGLPGVGAMLEARRFYPYNHAASTLIGKVGVDGNGLSGIERRYETRLHGEHRKDRVFRDALGNFIFADDPVKLVELPQGGSMQLTIDAMLQTILQQELERGRAHANARGAMGVMVDAYTGDILALGHSPSVNFNVPGNHTKKDLSEPVLESVFEPGSVMKPFVAAAALQEGLVSPRELINCESGRMSFGGHLIKDVHPIKTVSVYDVVVRSSNIGMAKLGVKLGATRLHDYLTQFGFNKSAGLGLPGETAGILRPVQSWAQVDVATHSFGHGMAVTPLQVVRAFSSLVNDGQPVSVRVVKGETAVEEQQAPLLRPEVVAQVKKMLVGAVSDPHGTGKNAAISGVVVGGKTGTAQVPRKDGRGYEPGAYIASFVGFAELPGRKLPYLPVLMISILHPDTNSIYGGTLAAPVFQKVMSRTLSHLAAKNDVLIESPAEEVPHSMPEVSLARPQLVPAAYRP